MQTQIVLITGATAGIGRHNALALAQRGHHVLATGRDRAALAALRAEATGLRLDPVVLDVTDAASVDRALQEVDRLTDGYGVDVLVNNAGFGQLGAVLDVPDAAVAAQFETNVHGLLRVTRAFAPAMIARGRGRIVNVSSVGGRMVFPMGGVYHATKFAVEALSDALRMELAAHGVSVSVLEPGAIRTRFGETATRRLPVSARSPWANVYDSAIAVLARYEEWAAPPSAVSSALAHAIESTRPRARYVAPRYNRLGLMLHAWLPTWVADAAFRRAFGLDHRPLGGAARTVIAPGAA